MKTVYILMMVFTDGDFSEPRVFTTFEAAKNFAHELLKKDIYDPVMYDTFEIYKVPLM